MLPAFVHIYTIIGKYVIFIGIFQRNIYIFTYMTCLVLKIVIELISLLISEEKWCL